MKLSTLILTSVLLTTVTRPSYAADSVTDGPKGCLAVYEAVEKRINAWPYKVVRPLGYTGGTAGTYFAAAGAVTTAAAAFGVMFGTAAVISGVTLIHEGKIKAAQTTIEGAYAENTKIDKMLDSVNTKLHHANLPAITEARLAEYIRSGNESGAFCPIVGFTSENVPVYKVLTRKHIRRAVIRSILEESKSQLASAIWTK